MPDGLIWEATAHGISSCRGRSCSAASWSVNQSDWWVTRSPWNRRRMTPMASSCRSRNSIGSIASVWASDASAPGPEPKMARPPVMWSSWTMRWATLNGWWYGSDTTPVASLMRWVRSPAAARNISGDAIISQPLEWCSPHQNSSYPSRSRCSTRSRSRRNCSIGCSPIG